MTEQQTDLIIFDLGNVLVDFDFNAIVKNLKTYSTLSEAEIRHFFETTPLWDKFERGGMTAEEFFEALTNELRLKGLSFQEFKPLWNNIFTEKHDTVAILKRLRAHYRLAMLSNVNQMHWDHIRKQFAFMNWFDYPLASWEVGLRKPEEDIFRISLERAGVPPERAVFIDDLPSHISAAQSVGMRAHRFHSARQLLSDIRDLFK